MKETLSSPPHSQTVKIMTVDAAPRCDAGERDYKSWLDPKETPRQSLSGLFKA